MNHHPFSFHLAVAFRGVLFVVATLACAIAAPSLADAQVADAPAELQVSALAENGGAALPGAGPAECREVVGPAPRRARPGDSLLHECQEFILVQGECYEALGMTICYLNRCYLSREYTRTVTYTAGIGIPGIQAGATITETETMCEYGAGGACGTFNAAAT